MIIISTSLTMSGHPKPQFHVEAWLLFRNCEMVYSAHFSCRNLVFILLEQSRHSITTENARGTVTNLFINR